MASTETNDGPDLRISLVVPVRDESGTLDELLASIASQDLAPDEILFVDGGSEDDTPGRLRASSSRIPALRLIEAGAATPGRGRNVGIAEARNEWIALTDAGIRLEPDWLRQLAQAAAGTPTPDIVYGHYEPVAGTFYEKCAALSYVPPPTVRSEGAIRGPSIASCLLQRRLWERVGGFPDQRAAEDLEFMERVSRSGAVIAWAPRAKVHWRLQSTLAQTFRRFSLYSKHNVWAGRQWDWHYGIARIYLSALALVLLSILHHPAWLMGLLLGLLFRVGRTLWRHRSGRGMSWFLNPFQFAAVAVIMTTIDLAALAGWVQASISSRSHAVPAGSRPPQQPHGR